MASRAEVADALAAALDAGQEELAGLLAQIDEANSKAPGVWGMLARDEASVMKVVLAYYRLQDTMIKLATQMGFTDPTPPIETPKRKAKYDPR